MTAVKAPSISRQPFFRKSGHQDDEASRGTAVYNTLQPQKILSEFLLTICEGKSKGWNLCPKHPDELNSEYINLQECFQTFLNLLTLGDTQDGTQKQKRTVQAISQDCLYAEVWERLILPSTYCCRGESKHLQVM